MMKTETKYAEPLGFKGTPGEWYRNNFGEIMSMADSGKILAYAFRFDSDAAILQHSKEMAKALQNMLIWQYCFDPRNDEEKEVFDNCCKNAKQILKNAGL